MNYAPAPVYRLTRPAVENLARLYPYEVETSEELAESLAFLQSELTPEVIARAGYGAGLITLLLSTPLILSSLPLPAVVVLMITFSLTVVHFVHSAPNILAAFRRTEALGQAPNLIGRIALRMHIQPATETAVRFAAETGFGRLSESLTYHITQSIGTHRTGLLAFAEEWSDEFPAIRRSSHLLATAQDAPEAQRSRTLDRALHAVLDGTRDQMSEFTERIRAPSMMLYAFGVMVPLALVGLVPAASLAGIEITVDAFVIIYNVILPVVLLSVSIWLLVRRPVAFPPPEVTRAHPDVPNRIWPSFVVAISAGIIGFVAVNMVGFGYLAPVSTVGLALGGGFYFFYRPIAIVRAHVRNVEEHLVDALYIVGRQVDENEAVEAAIQLAGERVPGETGKVFTEASEVQRRLHLTVEEAFLGEYGALKDIPSPRARSTASLLAIAAHEGQPAGRAIVEMANHLKDLQDVERKTKRELSQVTGTLKNTGFMFGPIVAGATIGMADIMSTSGIDYFDMGTLPTQDLGVVVGFYIITLAMILTALSIGLQYGLDRSLVGFETGKALLIGVPTYIISVMAIHLFI